MLAKLRARWNTVLAKVVNDTGQHGLFLRLSADPRELAEARVRPFVLALRGDVNPDDKVASGKWREKSRARCAERGPN